MRRELGEEMRGKKHQISQHCDIDEGQKNDLVWCAVVQDDPSLGVSLLTAFSCLQAWCQYANSSQMAFSLAVADSCQTHARLHPHVPPLEATTTAAITRMRVVVAVCLLPAATQSCPNDVQICCPHRGEEPSRTGKAAANESKYLLRHASKCNYMIRKCHHSQASDNTQKFSVLFSSLFIC